MSFAKVASGMYFSGETAISEVAVGGLVLDLHHRVLAIVQADELDFLGRQVVKRNLRRVTRELNVAGNPQEVRLTRVNGIRVRVTPLSHEGKNLAGLNQLVATVVLIIECQRPGKLRNASTDRPLLERAAEHVIPLTVKRGSHRQRERTSIADRDVTNRDRQLRPAIHVLCMRVGSRRQRKPTADVV